MRLELGADVMQGHAQEGRVTMSIVTSWVTHVWQGDGAALPWAGGGVPARLWGAAASLLVPLQPLVLLPPALPHSQGMAVCRPHENTLLGRPRLGGGARAGGTHRAPAGSSTGCGWPLIACLSWRQPGSAWVPCGK